MKEIASSEEEKFRLGKGSFREVVDANRVALHAELELCETAKQKLLALEQFLPMVKKYEMMLTQKLKDGRETRTEFLKAKADRLQIEIAIERVKASSR